MFTEPTTTTSVSVISSESCSKCGTAKRSGKRSCCARGGAWFQKCGDAGDSNVGHTWVEGIQACKYRSSLPIEASAQVMRRHEIVINRPANKTWARNFIEQLTDKRWSNLFGVVTANSESIVGMANITVFACLLFI